MRLIFRVTKGTILREDGSNGLETLPDWGKSRRLDATRGKNLNGKAQPLMDRAILARVEKQAWFHAHPRSLPIILCVITVAITLLSVFAMERTDAERRRMELDRNAVEIGSGLQRRASENIAYLRAAAALVRPDETLSDNRFRDFARSVFGDHDYHGSMGLGWVRVMPADRIAQLETGMRERGVPGYKVRREPDATGPLIAPIIYIEPKTAANRAAIGYDMYSEPNRREAMDRAARLGEPAATSRIVLAQDRNAPQPGFLIYMPVYENDVPANGVRGYVYSPFRATEFLASASQIFGHPQVEISLYDEIKRPDRLLASYLQPGVNGESLDRPLVIAGRRWILTVAEKKPQALSTLSRITLLLGCVIAVLLLFIARLITKRAAEDRQVLEWLSRQASIRTSLTRELNHRVKNTLANVLSIVALTRRRYTDIGEFAERLTGRIRALSATHDLLSQSDWSNAPIDEIVRSELAPYIDPFDNHVEMGGPDVSLAPNDALSLGMAIHELATNASKYGGLSTHEGTIHVHWKLVAPELVEIHWREEGGPPVRAPDRRGFGMELIEKIVAHELQSQVDLRFDPAGLQCTLRVPVRKLSDFALRTGVR